MVVHPHHQTFSNRKNNKGKLYIILKRIYQRLRISLNNRKIKKKNLDFASWSQKLRSGKIGQNCNVFLWIKCYETGINQIIN